MEAATLSITPVLEKVWERRERDYNIFLASLYSWEIHALCRGRALGNPEESLEVSAHDMFVAGIIDTDFISHQILVLLGE